MILDTSYFINKSVFIPNVVAQPSIGSNTPTAINQLQQEIDEKEYEYFISILGNEQTNELFTQFEENGDWKLEALQKWKDLIDGKDDWKGIRYSIGTKKISLIAYYVFFYYLKNDFSNYSTTGVQIPQSENSISQLPNEKQVNAWNTFVSMNSSIKNSNPIFSSNWNGRMIQFSGVQDNKVSVYDFLSRNSGVYDLSFFTHYSPINSMNL